MKKVLATAVALALAGLTGNAFAITDSEANQNFSFGFANPGARALGMGGAFVGLADDASAAYVNPSGLTQLVSPEVSAELRSEQVDVRFQDGGNAQFNPFDASGLSYSSQTSTTTSLRSFSFVYPREKMSMAFYRLELVNSDYNYSSAAATVTTGDGSGVSATIFPFDVDFALDVEVYGMAMGIKATDKLSLGFGLNYFLLDINSTVDRFNADTFNLGEFIQVNREANLDGDGRFGFTLGARYAANDWLSIGASYRRAPELGYDAVLSAPGTTDTFTRDTGLDVPDVFGVGFSIRPSESWVINFDVNRVFYSDVTDDLTSVFDANQALDLEPLKLDDGTEVRLGAEYTFATAHPFSIRAGIWRDPAHDLAYRGTPPSIDLSVNNVPVNAVTFAAGRDDAQTHVAIGAGMAFEKFQIDLGADFSDTVDILSMSGVFRF